MRRFVPVVSLIALAACAVPPPTAPADAEAPRNARPGSRSPAARRPSPVATPRVVPSPVASAAASPAMPTATGGASPSPFVPPLVGSSAAPSSPVPASTAPAASPTTATQASPSAAPSAAATGPLAGVATYAREVAIAFPFGIAATDAPEGPSTLDAVEAMAVAPDGKLLVACDNGRIWRVDLAAQALSHVAGAGAASSFDRVDKDGPAKEAVFKSPDAIAADADGTIYVANERHVRRIKDGVVDTIAGTEAEGLWVFEGPAASVHILAASALWLDGKGGLYLGDVGNIRRIDLTTPGFPVVNVAGTTSGNAGGATGPGATVDFSFVSNLAPDGKGGLYLADGLDETVRRVDLVAPDHPVTLVADGSEAATAGQDPEARIDAFDPSSFVVLPDGTLLAMDRGDFKTRNRRIAQVTADGKVSTFVGGADFRAPKIGVGTSVSVFWRSAIVRGPDGTIYYGGSDGTLYGIR